LTLAGDFSSFGFVPRKLRVEYKGAIYHLINRGDRREPIFKDDKDRELFLETLGQCCAKTDWQVHAYCLMPNHFHLVIETPRANLVAGMKWFLGTYTGRFNRRHKLFGHLFSGRYKSLVVDGSGTGYLRTVCDYVHLNPVRAKLLGPGHSLQKYRWSSYPAYLSRKRAPWLRVDRLLGEMGIPKDSRGGRQAFEKRMQERAAQENPKDYKPLRRGWCLGDKAFRKELLGQMAERVGQSHYGAERQESGEEKAERIMREELKRRRWTEETLSSRRKGDSEKVKMAARLRRETIMTLKWIAERLHMGSWTHVSNCLGKTKQ
jgi:REP element-mobilizing transposase RayT